MLHFPDSSLVSTDARLPHYAQIHATALGDNDLCRISDDADIVAQYAMPESVFDIKQAVEVS
jgi:hypothetical protein